jgi:hypothetical protein
MILRFISLLLGESLCLSRSPTPIHALAKPRISLTQQIERLALKLPPTTPIVSQGSVSAQGARPWFPPLRVRIAELIPSLHGWLYRARVNKRAGLGGALH